MITVRSKRLDTIRSDWNQREIELGSYGMITLELDMSTGFLISRPQPTTEWYGAERPHHLELSSDLPPSRNLPRVLTLSTEGNTQRQRDLLVRWSQPDE
jgi:hypothetical protein